ncbi:MAG: neuromedin U [Eudoraea sp.]|nr:neuromedin U [Eudoraea sp.]
MRIFYLTIVCLIIVSTQNVFAQESSEDEIQKDAAAELAKKAQNPIANMISVPIQNNTNFGIGPFERSQNVTNVQPVIPTSLGSLNLINRFIAPVTYQPDISTESEGKFGLGDIVYQGFFTPAKAGKVVWGIGPVLSLPTATHETLGTGKWSAGPAAIVVAFPGKWVVGGIVYNSWSFAGNSDRADVNTGVLQYFLNYNLANAWYLTSSPILSVNWEASEDNKWIVPFGAGAGKIFAIGNQKFNGNVSAYWNVVKPAAIDGPDWTLRFQLTILFPN